MKKNMGAADKTIRVLIALAIAGLYATDVISGTLGIVLLAFSIIFVLTSLVSFCPLYTLLGVRTCSVNK